MENQTKYPNCLYKIYSENCLLYVGTTQQPLQDILHEHFFKEHGVKRINAECVTRIEYAFLPTEADLLVAYAFYVNKLKPALNHDGKAQDTLNISIPELKFHEYVSEDLERWKEQIKKKNREDEEKCCIRFQIEKERQQKMQEIFMISSMTDEDKQKIYDDWIRNFYEPVRNGLL